MLTQFVSMKKLHYLKIKIVNLLIKFVGQTVVGFLTDKDNLKLFKLVDLLYLVLIAMP